MLNAFALGISKGTSGGLVRDLSEYDPILTFQISGTFIIVYCRHKGANNLHFVAFCFTICSFPDKKMRMTLKVSFQNSIYRMCKVNLLHVCQPNPEIIKISLDQAPSSC